MNLQQIAATSTAVDLVEIENGKPVTTSLKVAEIFGKNHKDVLRDIRDKVLPFVSKDFNQRNFAPVNYADAKGEERPMFVITRDGFTMVAMGYTGAKAMKFKEDYITAFNLMEEALRGTTPNNEELIDLAAMRIATKLFPQFVKSIMPTLAKTIVEQIRSLPQGEALFTQPEPQQTTKRKRGQNTMMYTLHTWKIEATATGLVAVDKKEFQTTDHKALMARVKAITGTGVQYVVNREKLAA